MSIESFGTDDGSFIGDELNNLVADLIDEKDASHTTLFYTGTANVEMARRPVISAIRCEHDESDLPLSHSFSFS